jgi:hypothetical protein
VAQQQRRPLWRPGALLLLPLLWLVVAGVALLLAHREVDRGADAVDRARRGADAGAIVDGRLVPQLRVAQGRFDRAHRWVSGALLAPARLLPVAGRQLRSVSALSAAAAGVTRVAIDGMTDARPILAEPGGNTAARASSTRRLGQLADQAQAKLGRLHLGPRHGLLPPLAHARNRLADQLAELRANLARAVTGAGAVADILTGPRRYLLVAANNAEMRSGSGMFLSAGELESGPEGLRLNDVRSVTQIPVPAGAVPVTGDLADRWGWLSPNVDWRNLMASPRFDASAPLAAQMWVASGHRPVDGVIAVDPVALRGILAATGPVEVEGRRIGEGNVEEELLHAQYLRFPSEDEKPERREQLGNIAGGAFAALDAGKWSLPKLAAGLATAAAGRHLLMWSADGREQAAWSTLAVDGSLSPDSLLVSILNRGGNKLDPFLPVRAEVTATASGDETDVAVTVHVANHVPEGEPRYVAGPERNSGVGEGVYLGILTVDMPGAARNARFDGVDSLAVAGPDGPCTVMGFQFTLPRGGERTFVARFSLPGRAGSVRVEASGRVPAIHWTSGRASWADGSPRVLTWARSVVER